MDTQTTNTNFEGWAVVELMGHQKEVGFVTTRYFGGPALFQVDVPELPEREVEMKRPEYATFTNLAGEEEYSLLPAGSKVIRGAVAARTRFVSPAAIYALNPCTEEAARKVIETSRPRSIALVSLPERKQLAAALPGEPDQDDEDEETA
jgi:hypothetical protein